MGMVLNGFTYYLIQFYKIIQAPIILNVSCDGIFMQSFYFLADFTDTYSLFFITCVLVLTCLSLANYKFELYAVKESLLNSSNTNKIKFYSVKVRLEAKLLFKKTIQYI